MTNAEKQKAYRERKGIFPHIFKHETPAQRQKAYRESHRDTLKKRDPLLMTIKRQDIKTEVLSHYGNGKCGCVICGESRMNCLSLDHINGGGNQHRKSINCQGYRLYQYLKKNNFPIGYQTLCMNDQWLKRYEKKEYNHLATKVTTPIT